MGAPITFRRPRPTSYVLLVASVGDGTGHLEPDKARRYNLEGFKPAGTEYATDTDLAEAGYVPAREVQRVNEHAARWAAEAIRILDTVKNQGPANTQVALAGAMAALEEVPKGTRPAECIEKRKVAELLAALRSAETREEGEAALEALEAAVATDGPVSRETASAE